MKKLFFLFLIVQSLLFAQSHSKAMIIFDASGSMWGQIDGKAKITIAKDALKSVVQGWNENTQLGVMAYGHRVKGDCNDIETLVPIGKPNKAKIINAVMGISPKGKTPISRSLKKAANELKFTEDKATVILISDGKETCDPDPCGTAKALKKQGIDFVAHVIGFNVDKATDKELACIANATGGEYFSAKSAKELNSAIKEVAKKVEKPTPPPPPKPKVKKLDHNIEVTASESEDGKWISANCRAYNEDKSDDWYIGPRKNKPGVKSLPIGKYTLNCQYNAFEKKDIPFEIKAGEVTKIHVVMGQTGKVSVTASESEGGKWISANCRIYNEDKSDDWYIGPRRSKPGVKQIPVGKYTLNCQYNAFEKKDIPFEVKPGETTKVHVVFVSFLITTKCKGKVNYEIYASNGQLVFEDSNVECNKPLKVTLNPGDYTVTVTQNENKKEQKFRVGGNSSSLTIDLSKQESKEELIKADSPNANSAKSELEEIKKAQKMPKITKDEAKELEERLKRAKDIVNMAAKMVGKDTKEQQIKTDKKFEELSKDIEMFSK